MLTTNHHKILRAYFELMKPRITSLVLITTALGFILAAKGLKPYGLFIALMLGTGATCAGASALNHYLERDADKKMLRTRNRPIPMGILSPNNAMLFGIILVLVGVFLLWWWVNLLTAFLSLLTAFLYVVVYTPLKRLSWLNTSIGAIPGALPPLGGWAAAQGELSIAAWVLFLILFVWQHPHFYSIAWMYRDDYKRGGFKMLPVVDPDGKSTFFQINAFGMVLVLVSLLPFVIGMSGTIYLSGAITLSILLFLSGLRLNASHSIKDAKVLLHNSVIYLPALLSLIVLDMKF